MRKAFQFLLKDGGKTESGDKTPSVWQEQSFLFKLPSHFQVACFGLPSLPGRVGPIWPVLDRLSLSTKSWLASSSSYLNMINIKPTKTYELVSN